MKEYASTYTWCGKCWEVVTNDSDEVLYIRLYDSESDNRVETHIDIDCNASEAVLLARRIRRHGVLVSEDTY